MASWCVFDLTVMKGPGRTREDASGPRVLYLPGRTHRGKRASVLAFFLRWAGVVHRDADAADAWTSTDAMPVWLAITRGYVARWRLRTFFFLTHWKSLELWPSITPSLIIWFDHKASKFAFASFLSNVRRNLTFNFTLQKNFFYKTTILLHLKYSSQLFNI